MKAITIRQPWASLIVEGIKPIENRSWRTNYRGRVLIHAGMAKTSGLMARYLSFEQHIEFRKIVGYSGLDFFEPKGAIIGSVEIVDCVQNHPSIWAIHSQWHWVLANPIQFTEPIFTKGKLNLWDYPHILAEPEEKNGPLFCHCNIPVKEGYQVRPNGDGTYNCRYCGGKWYK